jgi:hypothetical protein
MKSTQRDMFQSQTVHIDGRAFIQRLVLCRKPECWCSKGERNPRTGKAGHGPYWYEIKWVQGKCTTKYVGKELLTNALARN